MMSHIYEREREVALAAAREANAVVRQAHNHGAAASTKDGHPLNLVTETDVAVEALLIERLSAAFPGDGFLGEESGNSDPVAGQASGRRWVIDPICGTRNFTYRMPSVATNIALLDGERPVLAVVALSPGGDLLWAVAGEGAYARQADHTDTPIKVSGSSHMVNIDFGFALLSGDSTHIAAVTALLARLGRFPLRAIGSSASLAYQAQGLLAGNLFRGSKPWDVIAGCLLCQEAGALVTDFQGLPWRPFGESFLVASDAQTHGLIRQAIADAPMVEPILDAWFAALPPQNSGTGEGRTAATG